MNEPQSERQSIINRANWYNNWIIISWHLFLQVVFLGALLYFFMKLAMNFNTVVALAFTWPWAGIFAYFLYRVHRMHDPGYTRPGDWLMVRQVCLGYISLLLVEFDILFIRTARNMP